MKWEDHIHRLRIPIRRDLFHEKVHLVLGSYKLCGTEGLTNGQRSNGGVVLPRCLFGVALDQGIKFAVDFALIGKVIVKEEKLRRR